MGKNLGGALAFPNVMGDARQVGEARVYPGRRIPGVLSGFTLKLELQCGDWGGEVVSDCHLSLLGPWVSAGVPAWEDTGHPRRELVGPQKQSGQAWLLAQVGREGELGVL